MQHRYQQFQRRMARHYLDQNSNTESNGISETSSASREPRRNALGKLSKSQASGRQSDRQTSSHSTAPQSRIHPGPSNSVGFAIYSDPADASAPPGIVLCAHDTHVSVLILQYLVGASTTTAMMAENSDWKTLAPQASVRKENDGV